MPSGDAGLKKESLYKECNRFQALPGRLISGTAKQPQLCARSCRGHASFILQDCVCEAAHLEDELDQLTAEAAKIAGVQDVVSQRVSLDSHQVSMQ